MKASKRILCLLLAALLLSSCCLSFARSGKDYSGYRQYVSLGDSIANGIGENNVENKYMYRTPGAYPDRIAQETGAELTQLACGGMRTVELRACLEDDYIMPDELANNFSRAKVDEIRSFYAPAIKSADLITLNIGSNDILTYAMLRAKSASSALGIRIDSAIAELETKGEYTAALVALLDAVKTIDKYGTIVSEAIDGLYDGYVHFCQNWEAIIGDIYALNPDVTLMVTGFYNPFNELKLTDDSLIELGKAADGIMDALNLTITRNSAYAERYIYVDIMGVQSIAAKYGDSLLDEGFFQSVELDVHPSNEGQADIAQRFMALLPEKSCVPFGDISSLPLEFRNAIEAAYRKGITNGKSADAFCPSDTCTRAEIITMLWRAAGSPVMKTRCPFTDVSSGDFFYEAVRWACTRGITRGVSETQFSPYSVCTRAEIVTMLYRYAGSPFVIARSDFKDVSPSSYYCNAVCWAVQNGITKGVDAQHFDPDGLCTRVQAVTFIYRLFN